jgi:4-aminobutyrate aminotransferase
MDMNSLLFEGDLNLSEEKKAWQEQNLSQSVFDILKLDEKYFVHQSLSTPCLNVVSAGNGSFIIDGQGRKILDLHGNNVHQLGYNNALLLEVLRKQLDALTFSPRRYTNVQVIKLAKKLCETTHHQLNKVLFAPGGAAVNSIALKYARHATGKHKILSTWDSFHGAGIDTIAVGGEALFRKGLGPLLPGVFHVPSVGTADHIFKNEMAYADYVELVIEKEGEIGALITETIRNTSVIIPSKQYWQRIREICNRNNMMLILDEVATGLGRTGKMYAFEHYDIFPDIVTIGKGLGGGLFPFAAMMVNDKWKIDPTTSLGHFTHEKSPIGSAIGNAVIEIIEKEIASNFINLKAKQFHNQLLELKKEYKFIKEVRGIGMLFGIQLDDGDSKDQTTALTEQIMFKSLKNGLSYKTSQGNTLVLSPPLTIEESEIDMTVEILRKSFYEAYKTTSGIH